MRYADTETGIMHLFPDKLYRSEIKSDMINLKNYEQNFMKTIELTALKYNIYVIVIDNITYACNTSEKGVDARFFMKKLLDLKKKHPWSILVIAHTPKRSQCSLITQNDLAGSKKHINYSVSHK